VVVVARRQTGRKQGLYRMDDYAGGLPARKGGINLTTQA